MSGFKFEFNEREFERAIEKQVSGALNEKAKQLRSLFDDLVHNYAGRPVAEIKPVLQREWSRRIGGSITDPELTEYAQAISDGQGFDFRVSA